MEDEEPGGSEQDEDRSAGLSSQVLDYYKRFGRHRDLEQYFSLNTVQGEVRDPSSMFWRSIKTRNDSDTCGSASDVAEVCRISISCTVADPPSCQDDYSTSEKQEPDSPPIISEELNLIAPTTPVKNDEEHKSDLDASHKSMDLNLDTSINKLHSPTSSITSQRKLEWDSLADVGYANEKERKTPSNLSTLERLALQQQFSISDEMKHDNISGFPTAYSTPLDADNGKNKEKKEKKGLLKKFTKVSQKDVDVMEMNVDQGESGNVPTSINFNLTKHISFNIDPETGAASLSKCQTVKTEDLGNIMTHVNANASIKTQETTDKEIQTTLPSHSSAQPSVENIPKQKSRMHPDYIATLPVFLNLDMLRHSRHKGLRYRQTRITSKKLKASSKKQQKQKIHKEITKDQQEESIPPLEMTIGSQVSETDSFEYMPAHVYHQNTARNNLNEQSNTETSNKTSSLESSGGYTTLSSKQSEQSFSKDLEKGIALLNKLIQHRHQDSREKKKLVKEVVKGLIKSNYKDDETANSLFASLNFSSKLFSSKRKDKYQTTTSTSDLNNSGDANVSRPRKPILRSPKSLTTSARVTQAVGDLSAHFDSERTKNDELLYQNTSDTNFNTGSVENTSKEKSSSDGELPKTSSELLYQRYLDALKKEVKYKEHLISKQELLKHKLNQTKKSNPKVSENLKASSLNDLLRDLTKNTGAGDTSFRTNLVYSNPHSDRSSNERKHRSHSVFTLSSNSEIKNPTPTTSKQSSAEKQIEKRKLVPASAESQGDENNYVYNFERSPTSARIESQSHRSNDTFLSAHDVALAKTESHLSQRHNVSQFDRHTPLSRNEKPGTSRDTLIYEQIEALSKKESCATRNSVTQKINQPPGNTKREASASNSVYEVECSTFPRSRKFMSHYCCCPYHATKGRKVDSAVQVNKLNDHGSTAILTNSNVNLDNNLQSTSNTDFLCISSADKKAMKDFPDNFLIYKCSRVPVVLKPSLDNEIQKQSVSIQCSGEDIKNYPSENNEVEHMKFTHIIEQIGAIRKTDEENTPFAKVSKTQHDGKESSTDNTCTRSNVKDYFKRLDNLTNGSDQSHARIHTVPQMGRTIRQMHRNSETLKSNVYSESYMQTRFTIHPKISVPKLSDINVLDDDHPISDTNILPSRSINHDVNKIKADTYPRKPFGNSLVVQHHHESTKFNQNNIYKKQLETDSMLHDILQTDVISTKSKDSQTSHQLFNDDLYAYLNLEKSDSHDGMLASNEVMNTSNIKLLATDHPKEERSTNHVKIASISRHNLVAGVPSKSKEVSTQITPRCNENNKNVTIEDKNRDSEVPDERQQQSDKNNTENYTWPLPRESKSDPTLDLLQNSKKYEIITSNVKSIYNTDDKGKQKIIGSNDNTPKSDNKIRDASMSKHSDDDSNATKDTLLESIENIIKRYAKDDKPVSLDKKKSRQKQCKEIINKLQYLLHTDNSDAEEVNSKMSSDERKTSKTYSTITSTPDKIHNESETTSKTLVDKATQLQNHNDCKKSRDRIVYSRIKAKSHPVFASEDSSDMPQSSDMPGTSTDSLTCQIIRRIKKECEKFHKKHCQCTQHLEQLHSRHISSTSANRPRVDRHRHHSNKSVHRCINKCSKNADKVKKQNIAYNLIIESTDTVVENNISENDKTHLQNIIVKIPKAVSKKSINIYAQDKEGNVANLHNNREDPKPDNSKITESDGTLKVSSSSDDSESDSKEVRKIKFLTIQEYLARNRPDFMSNASERQRSLRIINEYRMRQQSAQRKLLSLQVEQDENVNSAHATCLKEMARQLGEELRRRRPEVKFISERAMKDHSRKIYKSLPEVVQKKEQDKKDKIKKTNLIMTSLFNKNLQKRTLQGAVDISNYSQVIQI